MPREVHPDLVPEVQQELVDQTAGNPLALLEHARALTAAQRRGLERFPVRARIEADARVLRRPGRGLPRGHTAMLLLVALEGRGDAAVLTEAAAMLGT